MEGGVLVPSEYLNGGFIRAFVYFLDFPIGFLPLQPSVMEIPIVYLAKVLSLPPASHPAASFPVYPFIPSPKSAFPPPPTPPSFISVWKFSAVLLIANS